ncbi:MAG TPA: hypothetical protein VMU09_04105 [Acidimicrobiales bacterium]|nr:hypothetical protein [Acidimicrobiales bacterium]
MRMHPDADPPVEDREMTAAEVAGFALDVQSRINLLIQQGVLLPLGQMENHYVIGLLEELLGAQRSLRVKEWHLSWVDRQLDTVEAQVRMQSLANLEAAANGRQP